MKKVFFATALVCAGSTLLSAATITDGNFTNWTFSGIGAGSMAREATSGNPGARLNVTTFTNLSSFAFGLGIDLDFTTTEVLSGAFSLSLDVLSGANDFGAGQAIALLVQQGSDIYEDFLANTSFPQSTFTTLGFSGTFLPANFKHIVGSGAATPNFSGGTSTLFGFMAYNSSNNRTLTKYYDNFALSYTSAAPEPSTWMLFGGGVLALGFYRLRRSA